VISIVVPVYRHKETLRELSGRVRRAMGDNPYEIVFVDDACPDGSLRALEDLVKGDSRVSVIALERNGGQHKAVLIGLRHAAGETAVIMDGDLQDRPEVIPELIDMMRKTGASAVFAGRCGRYESLTRLLTSRIYKRFLHILCGTPPDAGLFVAMDRRMVERLLAFDWFEPNIVAMMGLIGLPLVSVPVVRDRRVAGKSAYSARMRLGMGFSAVRQAFYHKLRLPGPLSGRNEEVGIKALIGARFASVKKDAPKKGEEENAKSRAGVFRGVS